MQSNTVEQRKLILGAIDNYRYFDIAKFLLSLKKINYQGKCVFFAGKGIKNDTIKKISEFGVSVIRVEDVVLPQEHKNLIGYLHIASVRYLLYYAYLLVNKDQYDNVLLADVRDVVFQSDPFEHCKEEGLYCALEDSTTSLSTGTNKNWMIEILGEQEFQKWSNYCISCSGTTMGATPQMLLYLQKMSELIVNNKSKTIGIDQGYHNYLVYGGQLNIVKCFTENSTILTMGLLQNYKITENNQLLNSADQIPSIVHQYDRHKILVKLFDEIYFKKGFEQLSYTLFLLKKNAIHKITSILR